MYFVVSLRSKGGEESNAANKSSYQLLWSKGANRTSAMSIFQCSQRVDHHSRVSALLSKT